MNKLSASGCVLCAHFQDWVAATTMYRLIVPGHPVLQLYMDTDNQSYTYRGVLLVHVEDREHNDLEKYFERIPGIVFLTEVVRVLRSVSI